MYGTVAAALSPIPYTVIITFFKPQNFDWADFAKQRLAFEKLDENLTTVDSRAVDAEESLDAEQVDVKRQELKRWGRIAAFWAVATFLGHWVLWPLPMYASHYVFGRSFYSAWLVIAIIWLWGTLLVAGFYPIIDGGYQQTMAICRAWRSGAKPPKPEPKREDPNLTPTSIASATNVDEVHISRDKAT